MQQYTNKISIFVMQRLYYTMRWVCVLLTSNVQKHVKRRNRLAFLPNA